MIAFPSLPIPANALRRTWVGHALESLEYGRLFHAILKRLAPEKAKAISPFDSHACSQEVIWNLNGRFPLYEPVFETLFSAADVWHNGIPIDLLGYHIDNSSSAALGLAFINLPGEYFQGVDVGHVYALDDHKDWIRTWWRGRIPEEQRRPMRPPRGYTFTSPWDGLPDLADYVQSNTGYHFLDYNDEEDGITFPPWNYGEIRAQERLWHRAEPVYKRITTLAQYIDADVKVRLPLLDRVMHGDRDALRQISTPPARRGRTLASVFTRMHR